MACVADPRPTLRPLCPTAWVRLHGTSCFSSLCVLLTYYYLPTTTSYQRVPWLQGLCMTRGA